jgi:hypothetical protein
MVAYKGPREGHDAWQGDAYHEFLMRRTAEHIGHPVEKAHELHMLNKDHLKERLNAAGSLSRDVHREAMEHQAIVNRAHPSYSAALNRRARLVKHDDAKSHFGRITELLTEHHAHGTSTDRQLEIHAELKAIQDKLAHIENTLGD